MTESDHFKLSVSATATYLEEHSDPSANKYVFSYHIVISNEGIKTSQVVSRHWLITDAMGKTKEVKGLAIVGQQPVISPGKRFEYTSGCELNTVSGSMKGTFYCLGEDGVPYQTPIPEFILLGPHTLH